MSRDVRWGFVGAGAIARTNVGPSTHYAAGAVLQAAAARDPARAAALEPAGRVHATYEALLADPDVDAVYVNLANDQHLPLTLAALAEGKHVLCEKPLALTAAEVATMTEAARAADRLLVEAFWYRWHPRTRRLEALLREGLLGEVTSADAAFAFDGPGDGDPAASFRLHPARGGGALYDVGSYTLSGLHLALGPHLQVKNVQRAIGPTGVDLVTHATLTTPDGAIGRLTCGISGLARQHFTITGTEASVAFAPDHQIFASWMTPSALAITRDGVTTEEPFPGDDPYRIMIEHVSAAIRGEDAFAVPLSHSLQIAHTADTIRATPTTPR